jgi:hypothetical protein
MNVEIGTEAAQFPEKGYINGIFVAVRGGENGIAPAEAAGARWTTRSARLRKLATREPGLQRKTGLKSYENFKVAITLTMLKQEKFRTGVGAKFIYDKRMPKKNFPQIRPFSLYPILFQCPIIWEKFPTILLVI